MWDSIILLYAIIIMSACRYIYRIVLMITVLPLYSALLLSITPHRATLMLTLFFPLILLPVNFFSYFMNSRILALLDKKNVGVDEIYASLCIINGVMNA